MDGVEGGVLPCFLAAKCCALPARPFWHPLVYPPYPSHRHGGTLKCLKHLLRNKLVHHDSSK